MDIKKTYKFPFLPALLICTGLIIAMLVLNNNRFGPFKNGIVKSQDNSLRKSDYAGLEKITLEISAEAYTKMQTKREEAMAQKVLMTSDEDYVKAKVSFRNNTEKAEVRLKGDWTDHLKGDQWSFRVKMNSEATVMGMRKFSLHRPITRNYAGEWLFHQLLNEADVLNLQYHFVELELVVKGGAVHNTKSLGLYALEEAFDKHLLERNQRKEGVILKLNEAPMWEERAAFLAEDLTLEDLRLFKSFAEEDLVIEPFNESKILNDSNFYRQFLTGRALYKSFLQNKAKISEVFDVEKLAKYNAICNLLGANHALITHNLRVYYNVQTTRLEPIGFDANAIMQHDFLPTYLHGEKDPVYIQAYIDALKEVTSDEYLEKALNYPGFAEVVNLVKKEYPDYYYDEDILPVNRMVLKRIFAPVRSINVYFEGLENGYIQLTVDNFGRFPVEIRGIKNKAGRRFTSLDEAVSVPLGNSKVSLPMTSGYEQIFTDVKKRKIGFSAKQDIPDVRLAYNVLGSDFEKEVEIKTWEGRYAYDTNFAQLRDKGNIDNFTFLEVKEDKKEIYFPAGIHVFKEQLVIPAGYKVYIGPDTKIDIGDFTAGFISYSPVYIKGSPEAPVEIFSESGRGLGFAVFNARDTSFVEYCKFNKISNPRKWQWFMSGSVNFYESPLIMKHCSITGNRSEDALNVIRCYLELDDVIFSDTQSDAFDGDYVTGTVKNCLFGNIGNDAIDVSGSDISIENITITNAGDKGLSAGEKSTFRAKNVLIKNSEIAVAAKDNSSLELINAKLENNKLNFTAFQKKPEFGPAHITAKEIDSPSFETEYLIEVNSSLLLNGVEAKTVTEVKDRMYGVDFGVSSKETRN